VCECVHVEMLVVSHSHSHAYQDYDFAWELQDPLFLQEPKNFSSPNYFN